MCREYELFKEFYHELYIDLRSYNTGTIIIVDHHLHPARMHACASLRTVCYIGRGWGCGPGRTPDVTVRLRDHLKSSSDNDATELLLPSSLLVLAAVSDSGRIGNCERTRYYDLYLMYECRSSLVCVTYVATSSSPLLNNTYFSQM